MQSLKSPAAIFYFILISVFSSVIAFAQADTVSFNGHWYSRIRSAPVIDMRPFDAENVFSKETTARVNEASVHIKAVRHFRKQYKEVAAEVWSGGTHGYTVRFLEGQVLTTLRYTRSGQLIHSMKRYNESAMPKGVRGLVKPVYYDYSIVVVYEMMGNLNTLPSYYVHLREGLKYKIVKVNSNEMEEIQSITLQKY
jgi:hypothetical protein